MGEEAISLKPAFTAQGDFFFGKGLRATRASTLSPNLGGCSLAALFSGKKMLFGRVLRLETALKAPLLEKGVKAFLKVSLKG